MKDFDKRFEPEVKGVMEARSEHKAGERELGKDPKSGRPVFVKIGRFGPVVQIGTAEDKDKPQFAQLPADKSIETITLEEALELFKLPRQVGEFEGTTVTIGSGRFGPYVLHDRKYVSIPKEIDPMAITLEQAVELINEKRSNEQKRHIKTFEEDNKLELLNGRYGPYIAFDGKNILTMLTASLTEPPPLLLRSKTSPLAPCFFRSMKARRTSLAQLSVKELKLI
jgi:DNA topoisomerase I